MVYVGLWIWVKLNRCLWTGRRLDCWPSQAYWKNRRDNMCAMLRLAHMSVMWVRSAQIHMRMPAVCWLIWLIYWKTSVFRPACNMGTWVPPGGQNIALGNTPLLFLPVIYCTNIFSLKNLRYHSSMGPKEFQLKLFWEPI